MTTACSHLAQLPSASLLHNARLTMSSAVPTPRVTIHDLPPELLSRAFVHLREPLREMATVPETRKCASPLLAAALVSKLWSALIQHELYGRLWMPRSYSDEDRAQQWLESPARLRHSVHELRLPRAGTAVAREVLEACPDLRRLSLPDDVEESWEVLRQFPCEKAKKIRALLC